jgi:putative Ca2+/H+ antiporter (TMEM165/GDT1 family)
MATFLLALLATLLAGWGDRTQLLAAQLTARYARPEAVLGGTALAALAAAGIGAGGGALLQGEITDFAIHLMLVLALAFAGVVGLIMPPPPGRALRFKGGPFLSAAIFGFAFASGNRAQLLILALAARADLPLMAFLGGVAGMIAAAAPAALLGQPFLEVRAVKWGRIAIALLFLLAAAAMLVMGA